jgi:ABC-type transport system involved in multi-copper enzyme maturation permease subunit
MTDAMAAEWAKLRTVRSTYIILGVAVAFVGAGVLLTWQAIAIWDGLSPERRARFGLGDVTALITWIGGLCLAILGILSVSPDYRTGMIRTTFTALPGRRTVLAAKASVVGAIALVAGLAMTFLTFFGTRLVVGDRPIEGHRTAITHELPELFARTGLIVVYALLGVGLVVLLRSTAGAIVTIVVPWYPLPMLMGLLPDPWGERIAAFVPDALPGQIAGHASNASSIYSDVLSPPWAATMMLVYALLPLCVAAFALRRRDA